MMSSGPLWKNADQTLQLKRSGSHYAGPPGPIQAHDGFERADYGGYLLRGEADPFALKRSGSNTLGPVGAIEPRHGFERTACGGHYAHR